MLLRRIGVKTMNLHAGTVGELAALTAEFFRCVTFTAGEKPFYAGIRGLFVHGGLLIKNISDQPEVSDVEGFIAPRQRLVDEGELTEFEEVELSAITEVFGRVAHRFSSYAKRGCQAGVAFQTRGVVTTQFIQTPAGWKMTSMAWDDERPGLTVPERYL